MNPVLKRLQLALAKRGLFLSIGELDTDMSALRDKRTQRGKKSTAIRYDVTHRGGTQ
jgi:hypothetical protein